MKYKVGDKVKVITSQDHGFEKGEVVTITEVFDDHYKAESENDFWYVVDKDITLEERTKSFTKEDMLKAFQAGEDGSDDYRRENGCASEYTAQTIQFEKFIEENY